MARDLFHDVVRDGLTAEGWRITHDPLPVDYGDVQMQIDLGAEKLIGAERGNQQIAIEVKSFNSPSAISEFHKAVGQFLNYRRALKAVEPERVLHLAVPSQTYDEFFRLRFVSESVEEYQIKLVVYSIAERKLRQWIS